MKALYQRHKKAVHWGLLGLAAAWCLWYARPVDIHFLLGDASPNWTTELVIAVTSPYSRQSWTINPKDNQDGMELTAEVLTALEDLRFHRSPLEPILRLLPPMGGSAQSLDGETNYNIYLYFYDIKSEDEWDTLLSMQFCINRWSYGVYNHLPLYVSHGPEKGRELGAFLTELAGKYNADS